MVSVLVVVVAIVDIGVGSRRCRRWSQCWSSWSSLLLVASSSALVVIAISSSGGGDLDIGDDGGGWSPLWSSSHRIGIGDVSAFAAMAVVTLGSSFKRFHSL